MIELNTAAPLLPLPLPLPLPLLLLLLLSRAIQERRSEASELLPCLPARPRARPRYLYPASGWSVYFRGVGLWGEGERVERRTPMTRRQYNTN